MFGFLKKNTNCKLNIASAGATWTFTSAVILICLAWMPASAATFKPLGDLPGGSYISLATDVSGDGKVVVGISSSSDGQTPFRWTPTTGMESPPNRILVQFTVSQTNFTFYASAYRAIANYDGSIVAGSHSFGGGAFPIGTGAMVWPNGNLANTLPGLYVDGAPLSEASAISSDGASILGLANPNNVLSGPVQGISWVNAAPPQQFGGLMGGFVTGISGDGSIMVGVSRLGVSASPVIRWQNGIPTTINSLNGAYFQLTDDFGPRVSANGSVVIGYCGTAQACRWTEDGVESLGTLPGATRSIANDVSADGSVIVGKTTGSESRAFIWTEKNQMEDLYDKLIGQNVSGLAGWKLTTATGVSDNGRVIVGTGVNPAGQTEGWVADLDITSLVFREKDESLKGNFDSGFYAGFTGDEIPGFDHVGLRVNNRMYESNVGIEGSYYDPMADMTVDVPFIGPSGGIYSSHTFGSFVHNSASTIPKAEVLEIQIPQTLGRQMEEFIQARSGDTFQFLDFSSLDAWRATVSPTAQKGANNSFTCVGLLEWAAEQAGHNDGQGFVPDDMEEIRFIDVLGIDPIPTLSPELMSWVLNGDQVTPARIVDWLQGIFDPIEFILTDPKGRRIGFTEETGVLNEIPGAFYSGNGDVEQFLILNPIVGEYHMELFGLGSNSTAAFGSRHDGEYFSGFLANGESRTLVLSVVVPEPRAVTLFALAVAIALAGRTRARYLPW